MASAMDLGAAPAKAWGGRASANAEAMAVPFKKCLRDAFERKSKVGLCITARGLSGALQLVK